MFQIKITAEDAYKQAQQNKEELNKKKEENIDKYVSNLLKTIEDELNKDILQKIKDGEVSVVFNKYCAMCDDGDISPKYEYIKNVITLGLEEAKYCVTNFNIKSRYVTTFSGQWFIEVDIAIKWDK